MKKGHILINYNICDNAPECGGIAVCSETAGALFWNEKEQKVDYNADLCIACGKCADEEIGCPIGAIIIPKNEEEYARIEKEIEVDAQKIKDLQVERYGASPIEECISIDEFDNWLDKQDKTSVLLVELFSFNDTIQEIQCLLHSIKIKDINQFLNEETQFTKVEINELSDVQNPEIEELPALLIYKDNGFLGKIEGYYDESSKNDFFNKIKEIVK